MLLILDPDTPGAFIVSIDCRIASSSATQDDILAVVESTQAAQSTRSDTVNAERLMIYRTSNQSI